MNAETAKLIINDDTLTDERLDVLLEKAKKEALNHYYWKLDDIPTDDEKEVFYEKWEYEIYEIAAAMNSDDARGGLMSHTELGITRQWGETGKASINKALSAIPTKVYVV